MVGWLIRGAAALSPTPGRRLSPGPPLRGALCVMLGRVDDQVPERHVIAHPLRGALGEGLARRLEHVVGVGDPEVQKQQHQRGQHREQDPPAANHPPPLLRSPRDQLGAVKQRLRGRLSALWWPARPALSVSGGHADRALTICAEHKPVCRRSMRMRLDGARRPPRCHTRARAQQVVEELSEPVLRWARLPPRCARARRVQCGRERSSSGITRLR